MIKAYIIPFFLLCSVLVSSADVFVITKKGQGIVAVSVSVKGDKVEYTDKATGMVQSLPKKDVDALVPTVERGKTYDAAKIEKYIKRINLMKKKHKGAVRKLNEILQEWTVYQKGGAGLDQKIQAIRQEYDSSARGTSQYKDAVMGLGMVKFKDLQKKYTGEIDGQIEEIRADFVSYNMKKLESMVSKEVKDLENYEQFLALAYDVDGAGKPDDKKTIADMRVAIRTSTYKDICSSAYALFTTRKNIDGYLACRALLMKVLKKVASTDEEKDNLNKRIAMLVEHAAKANRSYNFENSGFPLSKEDLTILEKTQMFGSRATFQNVEFDEQCIIIPKKQPPSPIVWGRSFTMPLRLVFNRQPEEGVMLITRVPSSVGVSYERRFDLDLQDIKDGHLDINILEKFSPYPRGFEPAVNDSGNSVYYVYVVAPSGDGDGESTHLSAACCWTLTE